jgi:glycerophosphoryl diester phosphodiesterase
MSSAGRMQLAKTDAAQKKSSPASQLATQGSPASAGDLHSAYAEASPQAITQGGSQKFANKSKQGRQLAEFRHIAQNSPIAMQFKSMNAIMNVPVLSPVKPAIQLKASVPVNDDAALEAEADVMGAKALGQGAVQRHQPPDAGALQKIAFPASGTPAPVQGLFFAGQFGEAGKLVPVEVVTERLTTLQYAPENGMPLKDLVKKLAQGPHILFAGDDHSLINAVEDQLAGRAGHAHVLGKVAGGSAFRKIYRLSGQISTLPFDLYALESALLRQPANDDKQTGAIKVVLDSAKTLAPDLEYLLHEPDTALRRYKAKEILKDCEIISEYFSELLNTYGNEDNIRHFWKCFISLSAFGPLNFAIVEDATASGATAGKFANDLAGFGPAILANLRDIRLGLSRRPTIAVIAHRGNGPTNRNMGGLISQEDDRRKARRAENSPEAFEFALGEAANNLKDGKPGLDGIECDVFLSNDRVPIVTHEGNWFEQLKNAQQNAIQGKQDAPALKDVHKRKHVHQLNASQLTQIQRTDKPASRFMTLTELLDMARNVAFSYFDVTGRAFRIEIEMKGSKEEKAGGEGALRPGALRDATAKVVSKAVKSNYGMPVEYVLFNGTPADIPGFANLRRTKTALGGLFTGFGGENRLPAKLNRDDVDELRYGFNEDRNREGADALPQTEINLHDYIVTLVFAQEFAPRELADKVVEPSHDIKKNGGTNNAVSKDLAKRKKNAETSSDQNRETLFAFLSRIPPDMRLHLLTDYPELAPWIKGQLAGKSKESPSSSEERKEDGPRPATGGSVEKSKKSGNANRRNKF